jgi:hypothetical protein
MAQNPIYLLKVENGLELSLFEIRATTHISWTPTFEP